MRLTFVIGMGITLAAAGLAAAEERNLPPLPTAQPQRAAFEPILRAVQAGDIAAAVAATERLRAQSPEPAIAEPAAYLRGDLYLLRAESGEAEPLRLALEAFQAAELAYPSGEQSQRGQWRIGQIYRRLRLYPEAVATFKRLRARDPGGRYGARAAFELAGSYRAWGKLAEALAAYDGLDAVRLETADRAGAILGHADVLYRLERFRLAYARYRQCEATAPAALRADAAGLFQYADAGYRIGRYDHARELFLTVSNLHPADSTASVALARAGATLRQTGDRRAAARIDRLVHEIYPDSVGDQIARVVEGLDTLRAASGCVGATGLDRSTSCLGPMPVRPERTGRILAEVEGRIAALQQQRPLPAATRQALLEIAQRLHAEHRFEPALALLAWLRDAAQQAPSQPLLATALRATLVEAIGDLGERGEDLRVVELFYRYGTSFTPEILIGSAGFQVGLSHARVGLPTPAIELLDPVAADRGNAHEQEALLHLAQAYMARGDTAAVVRRLERYAQRFPNGRFQSEALELLGAALLRQGKADAAATVLSDWLRRFPHSPARTRVTLALADAERRLGAFAGEVALLEAVDTGAAGTAAALALRRGDAYFALQRYRDAASAYQRALAGTVSPEERDWARLRLAQSLRALGRAANADAVLAELAQNAADPLLQRLAAQPPAL